MRISFSQPVFLPWGGFFGRLIHSDVMVLLDDTFFAQGFTFVNRNRIKSPSGELWITVPIVKKGKGQQKIKELQIYEKKKWSKKFLSTLFHCYGKSIYFPKLYERLSKAVANDNCSFLQMVIAIIDIMKKELKIDNKIILQSELNILDKGTSLLISIAKHLKSNNIILPYPARKYIDLNQIQQEKINITYCIYNQIIYPQFWGDYIKNLSALDLLFSLGGNSLKIIKKSTLLRFSFLQMD